MQYKIASSDTPENLESYVNGLIGGGYKPIGGMIFVPEIKKEIFEEIGKNVTGFVNQGVSVRCAEWSQAMVKD